MGFDKLTAPLKGRPLIVWSLEAFELCPDVNSAVLVCSPSRIPEFTALVAQFPKIRLTVPGGAERADSVRNGLLAMEPLSPDLVAVHDAARPLVTPTLISAVIAAAREWGAAVAAEPVTDTIHRAAGAGALVETVPRDHLWAMQTPQVAGFEALKSALASSSRQPITDEVSALIRSGIHPRVVPHNGLNFKVTYPRDLTLAEAALPQR